MALRAGAAALARQLVRSAGHAAASTSGRTVQGSSDVPSVFSRQARSMSGGGHHGKAVTYEGLTLHEPARWHKVLGEGMCALMWFWIFYRFYHDYDTFLFGHARHFEHELHAEHHTLQHKEDGEEEHANAGQVQAAH